MGTHTGLNYGDTHTHWVELWTGLNTHWVELWGTHTRLNTHWVELWGHTLGATH